MQVTMQPKVPIPHVNDIVPAYLLNTLTVPSYLACISATILVLHTFSSFLTVRLRRKAVLQYPPVSLKPLHGNGASNAEKSFAELHGGLVIYVFKMFRLLCCFAFLVLSMATFRVDRHRERLFAVVRGRNLVYRSTFAGLGTSTPDWIGLFLCATSAYTFILSVITVTSHTGFSRLVSTHLTIVLLTLFAVYVYRDVWPFFTFTEQPIDLCEGLFLWGKLVCLTIGAVVYPLFSPRLYIPLDGVTPSDVPHPEQTASWASLLFYSWVGPTVRLAYRVGHLLQDQLPPLSDEDRTENLKRCSFRHLDHFSGAKRRHIFYGLMNVFRVEIMVLSLNIVIQVLASLLPPLGLKHLIRYLETGGEDALVRPWAWIVLILLGVGSSSVAYQWYHFIGCRAMVRAKAILSQLIFEHALRIRVKAESRGTGKPASRGPLEPGASGRASKSTRSTSAPTTKNLPGKLNNLITSDLAAATGGRDFLMLALRAPLQLIAATWLLYTLLEWSAMVGLVVMMIMSPLSYIVLRRIEHLKREQLSRRDARVQGITETMGVIRMVKLFGWESQMRQCIFDKREDELTWLWKLKMMQLINTIIIICLPLVTMLITYATYTVVMGRTLSASTVFASISAFDIFRYQLRSIFVYLPKIISARVSLDRINEFLLDTELLDRYDSEVRNSLPVPTNIVEELDLIGFKDATFTWSRDGAGGQAFVSSDRRFTLRVDGEVYFQRGCVNLIIGPTGSGKTSMLMALLGEMHWVPSHPRSWYNLPRDGGVAYAAQESWVQNDTIKNNILFGSPYDDARYKQVLHQCALEKDLQLFEARDDTEVGEKGLTLSGGQKARITLARAIYSQAETILLDDVLAALDVHTMSWIVDKCFAGDLVHGRTVILVTHSITAVRHIAQFVVSLAPNGRVVDQGCFADVIAKDEALAAIIAKERETQETGKDTEVVEAENGKPSGSGKLVMAEEVSVGHVSWAAFKLYLAALGGGHIMFFWLIVFALFVFSNLAHTLQTWFLGYWATQYEDHPPSEVNIGFYLSGYTLLLILGTFMWSLAFYVFYVGAIGAARTIHNKLIVAILGTTFRWLDTTPTSRVIARCTQDIRAIDGPLSTALSSLLEVSMKMMFSLGAVVVITPAFLLPGVLVGVIGAWIGRIYMKAQLSVKREMSNARAPVLGHLGVAMAGLTSIRAYGTEEAVIRESLARIDRYTRAARMFYNLNRWMSVRVDALGMLFEAGLAAYLVYGPVRHRAANTGFSLNMAVSFSYLILRWVRHFNEVEIHGNSLERMDNYIKVEQETQPTESGVPPAYWPASGDLCVENLSARYSPDGPKVLHNLSFRIKSGERIGIVGRTGSGKSSLTLSLLRCIFTEGQVYLDGMRTSRINLGALRSNVTIIPQIPELLSGTLRRNLDPLQEHDDATLNDVLRSAGLFTAQEGSEESRLTLDSLISGGGSNLSLGQRQILALARAMVRRSKLLILDEATSAIDYKTDAIIQSSLRNELSGTTQLIVAHRLQTIMDADKIMVLDAGKIVEFGKPSELLRQSKGMLRALVNESANREDLYSMASSSRSGEA